MADHDLESQNLKRQITFLTDIISKEQKRRDGQCNQENSKRQTSRYAMYNANIKPKTINHKQSFGASIHSKYSLNNRSTCDVSTKQFSPKYLCQKSTYKQYSPHIKPFVHSSTNKQLSFKSVVSATNNHALVLPRIYHKSFIHANHNNTHSSFHGQVTFNQQLQNLTTSKLNVNTLSESVTSKDDTIPKGFKLKQIIDDDTLNVTKPQVKLRYTKSDKTSAMTRQVIEAAPYSLIDRMSNKTCRQTDIESINVEYQKALLSTCPSKIIEGGGIEKKVFNMGREDVSNQNTKLENRFNLVRIRDVDNIKNMNMKRQVEIDTTNKVEAMTGKVTNNEGSNTISGSKNTKGEEMKNTCTNIKHNVDERKHLKEKAAIDSVKVQNIDFKCKSAQLKDMTITTGDVKCLSNMTYNEAVSMSGYTDMKVPEVKHNKENIKADNEEGEYRENVVQEAKCENIVGHPDDCIVESSVSKDCKNEDVSDVMSSYVSATVQMDGVSGNQHPLPFALFQDVQYSIKVEAGNGIKEGEQRGERNNDYTKKTQNIKIIGPTNVERSINKEIKLSLMTDIMEAERKLRDCKVDMQKTLDEAHRNKLKMKNGQTKTPLMEHSAQNIKNIIKNFKKSKNKRKYVAPHKSLTSVSGVFAYSKVSGRHLATRKFTNNYSMRNIGCVNTVGGRGKRMIHGETSTVSLSPHKLVKSFSGSLTSHTGDNSLMRHRTNNAWMSSKKGQRRFKYKKKCLMESKCGKPEINYYGSNEYMNSLTLHNQSYKHMDKFSQQMPTDFKRRWKGHYQLKQSAKKNKQKLILIDGQAFRKTDKKLINTTAYPSRLLHEKSSINKLSERVKKRAEKKRKKGTDQNAKNYCMFFTKFGRCFRSELCPFIHDKSRVVTCRRFLQGKCQVSDCPFSHVISVHKMPTCLYYMRGRCTRDVCPYLHVNVGKDAPICDDFQRGFCYQGDKCKYKHIYLSTRLYNAKPNMNGSGRLVKDLMITNSQLDYTDEMDDTEGSNDTRVVKFNGEKLPAFISLNSNKGLNIHNAGPETHQQHAGTLKIKPVL